MRNKFLISIAIMGMTVIPAFSHGIVKHDTKKDIPSKRIEILKNDYIKDVLEEEVSKEKIVNLEKNYEKINEKYLKNIKPIFKAKCFNCHSNTPIYPFYYKIPGITQMIDKDINEAKKHIDFSNNFPFISHETPLNDIKSLKKIALEGGMPPLKYILGHWDSKLAEEDTKSLLKWTEKAIEILKKENKSKN